MNDSGAGTEVAKIEIMPVPDECGFLSHLGDILWSTGADIVRCLKPHVIDPAAEQELYRPLTLLSDNPWRALDYAGIRYDNVRFLHRDPVTDRDEDGWVPCGIYTSRFESYVPVGHPQYNLLTDQGYVEFIIEDEILGLIGKREACVKTIHGRAHRDMAEWFLSHAGVLLMGSGYTSGCIPSDGHARQVLCHVDLSNGDELLVSVWDWYNK